MEIVVMCEKCGKNKATTDHHVFPVRFFKNQTKPLCAYLCRWCHDEIEKIIPQRIKLSAGQYLLIIVKFMGEAYAKKLLIKDYKLPK